MIRREFDIAFSYGKQDRASSGPGFAGRSKVTMASLPETEAPIAFRVTMAGGTRHRIRAWNGSLWTEVMNRRQRFGGPLATEEFLRTLGSMRTGAERAEWFNPFFHAYDWDAKPMRAADVKAQKPRLQRVADQIAFIGDVVHIRTAPPVWTVTPDLNRPDRPVLDVECRLPWLPDADWGRGLRDLKRISDAGDMPDGSSLFSWSRADEAKAFAAMIAGGAVEAVGAIEVEDRAVAGRHDRPGWDLALTIRQMDHVLGCTAQMVHNVPDAVMRRWMDMRRYDAAVRAADDPETADAVLFFQALADVCAGPGRGPARNLHHAKNHLLRWTEFEGRHRGLAERPELHPDDEDALSGLAP